MDVIVAGGGPVGLMLAGELALGGAHAVVLERDDRIGAPPMPRGVHARTLEVLDRRGLLGEFLRRGRTQPRVLFAGAWPLDVTGLDTPFPYSLAITQRDVVAILADRARALGVRVRTGHEVRDVAQDDDRVTVTTTGGKRLTARYAVGCDGGHSRVRTVAGFGFPGTPPTLTGIVGDVTLSPADAVPPGPQPHPTGLVVRGGPSALSAATVGAFEFGAPPHAGPVTGDDLAASLGRVGGIDVAVTGVRWIIRFTDNTRLADAYRRGRVLLAGDAAHVHFPSGGQGLNLGLQDAAALGGRLASVVTGQADPGALDAYETERRPVASRVLDLSRAQVHLMRPEPQAAALRGLVGELLVVPEAARHLAEVVAGLSGRS